MPASIHYWLTQIEIPSKNYFCHQKTATSTLESNASHQFPQKLNSTKRFLRIFKRHLIPRPSAQWNKLKR